MRNGSLDRPWQRQAGRFLLIGGSSVLIDYACYSLLAGLGAPAMAVKGMSYNAGMLFGFFGNKFWTFQAHAPSRREPLVYAALYTVTLAVNVGLHAAVLQWLGSDAKAFAFLVATGATTVLNFIGLKYLAFRPATLVTTPHS